MISTQRIIYCVNPGCTHPINPVGESVCASCQTPLVHRYLWASGSLAAAILPKTKVLDRYEVITPQVWLDTQPGLPPTVPEELPKEVIPYLRLYQERLHLPEVYGLVYAAEAGADDILLLENVPIDETGNLYPSIAEAWEKATAVRQVYWLWQILQLWKPLSELGVAHSLLMPDNLRSQGWCVRLLELHHTAATQKPSLADLAQSWQPWVASVNTPVSQELENIVQQMCSTEIELKTISTQLNTLLLATAAELPFSLKVAGATDVGPQLRQNEDNCYPMATSDLDDPILPRLTIVCDGIGGHQGGEVASQLAVQSLKLQIRALLTEVEAQTEPVPPDLFQEQLEASLRVVNNVLCACNDEQKRQGRERMATTLVMAVQVPQRVPTTSGWQSDNAHELYLANIGDSRAYWITPNYCQLLTVDDIVATREVRSARSLYRPALERIDATALTQALGTKDAEFLHIVIKRFIVEEDGVLLLCSDGLSDHNWVEKSWQDYVIPVLAGQISVADTVSNWINFANEKNGHDNTSVVMTLCRVSREYLVPVTPLLLPEEPEKLEELEEPEEESSLAESSQALLDLDLTLDNLPDSPIPTPVKSPIQRKPVVLIGGLLAVLVAATSLGLLAWWEVNPQGFQQICRQLPQRIQPICPKPSK
ncbi:MULTISPECIES: protein phosphatase 2C domain-containing protein [unclassified Nodularia (in: cyanobacteria)]|uniref:protein phosphatase 2C domain-containing protein n=1 Tax=unclassified Nodularia (in: cyanobacteria) TaxID=2656917 RepID=UPI00188226A4|nr:MULTISPECIES: protein phosphatase 2C domain-containing protein [unclassified Nodularia (in: cyanobacteria)]MBE9201099.1 protein phosphatase 2C domain-containing protein [Nodularia sp. LEGE 06071]MCC2694830.1 protein phosphatase 2C domain-containing protein [Nodularia sp. LEGE 04288]